MTDPAADNRCNIAVAAMVRKAAETFRNDPPRPPLLPHWIQAEKATFADALHRRAREIEARPARRAPTDRSRRDRDDAHH
ncbi:hypothetical protein [Micromonospora sp. RV43]|uniref:hypothetical protein n=1 Tax=Micromonospora sp. RV43 TaxID=1661387 RepID=UPI000B297A7E|nr:hypothetical protein [Micromonospora sp. RV43]